MHVDAQVSGTGNGRSVKTNARSAFVQDIPSIWEIKEGVGYICQDDQDDPVSSVRISAPWIAL
jgi:hypothetical protein